MQQPILPPGIRTLTDPESDRLKRLFPDLPKSPEQCVTCLGRKTYRWYALDDRRLEIVDYDCDCTDQWILYRYMLHSGIGKSYQRLSWNDATDVPKDAKNLVASYLEMAERYVEVGMGLHLYGTYGSGKSLLANLLLKGLLAKGYDGYFTTFNNMLELFTAGWSDIEDKRWFVRRIKNAGVLVLDDLGKEMRGRDLPMATFDEVLRHRVQMSKPTIITTNDPLEVVGRRYGSSALSLLVERSRVYEFEGKDFRPQFLERFDREVRMGLTRPLVWQ